MNSQLKTPLFQALIEHVNKNTVSFHVPGHKNGHIFQHETDFFQQILKIDATELSGLDDLHSPEGPILEAESLLAELYQVEKSFFLINGSTVGNLAMIMATCTEGATVLVQRNCHKSVLNALKLAKARPVFLAPEFDLEGRIAGGVAFETVKKAIRLYPNAKAVILTYPNYYGMVYDLQSIIDEAHKHHIPVLVDEAHGPHFIKGEPFPISAVKMGADIVVQSAHKTLPAMTMGSFLHVSGTLVDCDKLSEYLQMFQSSSPSYPIMASLDLARHYLAEYEKKDILFLLKEINAFKDELRKIPSIHVIDNEKGDPLKIVIQSQCGLSGYELQRRFEAVGIYTELADPYHVLFVIPLLKENQSYPLKETADKIKKELEGLSLQPKEEEVHIERLEISELAVPYHEMAKYEQKCVQIDEALDQVSAETVIPYPPGIPLLLKGEAVTKETLWNLKKLIKTGARFQGGTSLEAGYIKVFGGYKR